MPVNAGETYRAAVWVKARAFTGSRWLSLEFSDTAYEPVSVAKSEVVKTDCDWKKISLETIVPPNARWLRASLHTEANSGAVWFYDVEIRRTRPLK